MDTLENLEMDIARRDEAIREQGNRIVELEKELNFYKRATAELSSIVATICASSSK